MTAAIILEVLLLPIVIGMAILSANQKRARRARRIEEYRKSPESHILHLND